MKAEEKEIRIQNVVATAAFNHPVDLSRLFASCNQPISGFLQWPRRSNDEIYPEANISSRYSTLFEHLHAKCFYHGECGHLRKWISKAKKFIDDVAKLL